MNTNLYSLTLAEITALPSWVDIQGGEQKGGNFSSTWRSMIMNNCYFCQDRVSGLKAIICIHDTTLGPALGGTRMWTYESEDEAIEDALRLAKRHDI
ncbi:hypothetical protein GCM10020331_041240 [Ectobacillus funiculus]